MTDFIIKHPSGKKSWVGTLKAVRPDTKHPERLLAELELHSVTLPTTFTVPFEWCRKVEFDRA